MYTRFTLADLDNIDEAVLRECLIINRPEYKDILKGALTFLKGIHRGDKYRSLHIRIDTDEIVVSLLLDTSYKHVQHEKAGGGFPLGMHTKAMVGETGGKGVQTKGTTGMTPHQAASAAGQ